MISPCHRLIPNLRSKTGSRHEALGQISCAAAHFAHSPSTSIIDFIGLKRVVFAAPRNPRVINSDAVSRTRAALPANHENDRLSLSMKMVTSEI